MNTTMLSAETRKDAAADKLVEDFKAFTEDMRALTAALGDALNSEAEEGDPIGVLYGSMNHVMTLMSVSMKRFESEPRMDAGTDMVGILDTLVRNLDDTAQIFVLSPTHAMMFAGAKYSLYELIITYKSTVFAIKSQTTEN